MKRPSFQFYPGDWLHDAALRSCSVGARGLWIDMICLMHQGSEYGYLKVNHKVILIPNLARIVGSTLSDVEGWLMELEMAGVFSKGDDGGIYSRRMIRDEKLRESRASGGKLGGNPALLKVNLSANLKPTPSSSSSSSSSISTPKPLSPLATRVGKWFGRKDGRPLNPKEQKSLKVVESLKTPEDEIQLLEKYYTAPGVKYRRQDMVTLFNNWNGEIDKARTWRDNGSPNGQVNGEHQEEIPAW